VSQISNGFRLTSRIIRSSPLTLYNRDYSPFGKNYFEEYVKRLNSRNITIQTDAIMDMGNKRSVGSDGGTYDASDYH
jgi:hypothetical protein